MKINSNTHIIENSNQVVLVNFNNKKWLRSSKNYYNLLGQLLEQDGDISEKLGVFTKQYPKQGENLKKLYLALVDIEYFVIENKLNVSILQDITLMVTNKCNLNCKHCIVNASPLNTDELTLEEIKSIINKMIEVNPLGITFSGGEPFIRKDFIEIVKYAHDKFKGRIGVISNGTILAIEQIAEVVNYIDNIDISLDGYDETSVEIIRGQGVFSKVIDTVKNLQDKNFNKISLSMVLTKDNALNESKFMDLCDNLGVKGVMRPLHLDGRADSAFGEKSLQPLDMMFDELNCYKCQPGNKELTILHNGDIYPCNNLIEEEFKFGNIKDEKEILKEIVMQEKTYKSIFKSIDSLRPTTEKTCKDCKVNVFCWECIGRYQSIKKSDEKFKEFCNYKRKVLYKRVWGTTA